MSLKRACSCGVGIEINQKTMITVCGCGQVFNCVGEMIEWEDDEEKID